MSNLSTSAMRVVVLGGTRFIGRAAVEMLVARGHQVMVVHRGELEPPDLVQVHHVHVDRAALGDVRQQLAAFAPDAVLDSIALTRTDAEIAVAALPLAPRVVVLSSIDVYQAYAALLAGADSEPVPLTEDSPVRSERYFNRGKGGRTPDDYEKLDVEDVYLERGGTVLRLPMVHAIESTSVAGEVFNLAEAPTASMRLWGAQILSVAGHDAELLRVPDEVVPDDMQLTRSQSQHILADATKARRVLGWSHRDPIDGLRQSVTWHLANPPTDWDTNFAADDKALSSS